MPWAFDYRKLRRIIQEKETNKSALARAVKVHRDTLRRWLNGESEPSGSAALVIAEYYNMAIQDFYQKN